MNKRRAIVSPFLLVRLEALDEIINLPLIRQQLPELNTRNLLYSSMIQAGVDELQFVHPLEKDKPSSKFLLDRVMVRGGSEWAQAFTLLLDVFGSYLPDNYLNQRQYRDVVGLQNFLVDLLVSLRCGENLIRLSPMPDLKEVQNKLPAELLLPLEGLFSTFVDINADSILPRVEIDRDNIGLFQQIIASDLYKQYEAEHGGLDTTDKAVEHAFPRIRDASHRLLEGSPRLLRLGKTVASILPISEQVIEAIFGKLPGALASSSSKFLEKWLAQRRRLVIYQHWRTVQTMLGRRFDEYANKSARRSATSTEDGNTAKP